MFRLVGTQDKHKIGIEETDFAVAGYQRNVGIIGADSKTIDQETIEKPKLIS